MRTITLFDILILLAMFGGAFWGFFRGVFRQAVGTLVLYVATVISTLGYRGLARLISKEPTQATHMLAFLLLMIVMNVLLALATKDLFESLNLDRMNVWVNIGGMIFGFLNTAIWCAIVLMVIRSATSGAEWYAYPGVQAFFQNQTTNSWMAYVFGPFIRLLTTLIKPWMFGRELPPLLQTAL